MNYCLRSLLITLLAIFLLSSGTYAIFFNETLGPKTVETLTPRVRQLPKLSPLVEIPELVYYPSKNVTLRFVNPVGAPLNVSLTYGFGTNFPTQPTYRTIPPGSASFVQNVNASGIEQYWSTQNSNFLKLWNESQSSKALYLLPQYKSSVIHVNVLDSIRFLGWFSGVNRIQVGRVAQNISALVLITFYDGSGIDEVKFTLKKALANGTNLQLQVRNYHIQVAPGKEVYLSLPFSPKEPTTGTVSSYFVTISTATASSNSPPLKVGINATSSQSGLGDPQTSPSIEFEDIDFDPSHLRYKVTIDIRYPLPQYATLACIKINSRDICSEPIAGILFQKDQIRQDGGLFQHGGSFFPFEWYGYNFSIQIPLPNLTSDVVDRTFYPKFDAQWAWDANSSPIVVNSNPSSTDFVVGGVVRHSSSFIPWFAFFAMLLYGLSAFGLFLTGFLSGRKRRGAERITATENATLVISLLGPVLPILFNPGFWPYLGFLTFVILAVALGLINGVLFLVKPEILQGYELFELGLLFFPGLLVVGTLVAGVPSEIVPYWLLLLAAVVLIPLSPIIKKFI